MTSSIPSSHCEARFNPISQQIVLIAPKRNERPHAHEKCPGCNPTLTPPAVYVYPEHCDPDGDSWEVRVVPNKYSCFSIAGGNSRFESPSGFRSIQDPAGRCEVVFETRSHVHPVATRTVVEIQQCFRALVSRYRFARTDPRTKFWYAFKNLGKNAGGTLEHEHWQIYSLPFVPPAIQDRYDYAARYFNQTGQNLYQRIIENEANSGDRVVSQTMNFLTYVPFAAGMQYEMCISPLRYSADFSTMSDEEMLDLAAAFHGAVSRLNSVHPGLAFNVALHTAAFEHNAVPWYCWSLSILPRLSTLAGVELGINVMINPVAPEEAASALRAVCVP